MNHQITSEKQAYREGDGECRAQGKQEDSGGDDAVRIGHLLQLTQWTNQETRSMLVRKAEMQANSAVAYEHRVTTFPSEYRIAKVTMSPKMSTMVPMILMIIPMPAHTRKPEGEMSCNNQSIPIRRC